MAQPRRRAARPANAPSAEVPFRQPRNPLPPVEVLSPEQIDKIEQASFAILERTGIEWLSDRALDIWQKAGAHVDRETRRVRTDRGLILEKIKTAPSQFTLHARNPAHNTVMGGDYMVFASVSGPGYAMDIKRGRRNGTFEDLVNFIKLSQSFNVIHNIVLLIFEH